MVAAPLSLYSQSIDPQVALIGKLGVKMAGADSSVRLDTLIWIRDIVKDHPRDDVHSAAQMAIKSLPDFVHLDLGHIEVAGDILTHIVKAPSRDYEFESAVDHVIELARKTGRAGRQTVMNQLFESVKDQRGPRREAAIEKIRRFAADPRFEAESEEILRFAARLGH
jgi:hypothetical protein